MKTKCLCLLSLCALLTVPLASASTLSSNLTSASAGVEPVSDSTWIAASFGTAASSYNLSSITLLMSAGPGTGITLQLYSDNDMQPGYELAGLTAHMAATTSLSPVTFNGSGYLLAPQTTYWVVMQATSGRAQWAYAASSSGSGSGFQSTWAESLDAGADWFSFTSYPMLMSVQASAVPEPANLLSVLLGGLPLALALLRRRGQ